MTSCLFFSIQSPEPTSNNPRRENHILPFVISEISFRKYLEKSLRRIIFKYAIKVLNNIPFEFCKKLQKPDSIQVSPSRTSFPIAIGHLPKCKHLPINSTHLLASLSLCPGFCMPIFIPMLSYVIAHCLKYSSTYQNLFHPTLIPNLIALPFFQYASSFKEKATHPQTSYRYPG